MSLSLYMKGDFIVKGNIVLNDISLFLKGGKWHSLLGVSGIGKTTILRLFANLGTHGIFKGDIYSPDLQTKNLAPYISWMGQNDLLMPWLNVMDNILLGYKLRGKNDTECMKDLREQAHQLLKKMMLEKYAHSLPHELSGGMRQRVALARTLMEGRDIILMDEPFSSLDKITRYDMQELAADFLKNKTVLMVTHDPEEAIRLSHEIFLLYQRKDESQQIMGIQTFTPPPFEIIRPINDDICRDMHKSIIQKMRG